MSELDKETLKAFAVLALCEKFIRTQEISCPEAIAQTDRVIENAYAFIEEICNEVGYFAYPDDYGPEEA